MSTMKEAFNAKFIEKVGGVDMEFRKATLADFCAAQSYREGNPKDESSIAYIDSLVYILYLCWAGDKSTVDLEGFKAMIPIDVIHDGSLHSIVGKLGFFPRTPEKKSRQTGEQS